MKIAYLTNCFATQSHTFIRREIAALRALGVDIHLFGIRQDKKFEEDVRRYVEETQYLYPLKLGRIFTTNLKYLFKNPWRYTRGAVRAFFSPEFNLKRRAKMVFHYFVSAHMADLLEKQGINHIHAHFMNVSASVAMYASWHSGIPYSITVHSAGTYGTPHILGVHQKLREAQHLFMISHNNINYFDAIEPCRDKSTVVRCGMDLTDFTYREADQYQQHTPLRLLAVGRFVEKKGFIYLIEAAGIMQKQGIHFKLTLIGDGPLKPDVEARAKALNIEKCIDFMGQQATEYVRQAMTETDIVIIPSVTSKSGEKEGLPVVIMEAMATGVPVIASDHSGIPEIVQHKQTGLLTPEKNAQAIADAVINIHNNPPTDFIKQAHLLVHETFNINRIAEQRKKMFNSLV